MGAEPGPRTPRLGAGQDPPGPGSLRLDDRRGRLGGPDPPPLAGRHSRVRDLGQDRVGIGVRLEQPADDDVMPGGVGERCPPRGRLSMAG